MRTLWRKGLDFAASIADPRSYFHFLRLLHYYSYSHVKQKRLLSMGSDVSFSPNVSLTNAQRISIGDRTLIGSRCHLWAGNTAGRITIGNDCLLAPDVFITASNYGLSRAGTIRDQPKKEADVVVGDDVWIGARAMILPGVQIGDGCVVGAGAIVTRSLPEYTIAVGAPARGIMQR